MEIDIIKMYSGGTPEFREGDLFTTIIPLTAVATAKVGPGSDQVAPQVAPQDILYAKIPEFCTVARSRKEIMEFCGMRDRKNFKNRILGPLLKQGILIMTIPDKPNSRYQKYRKV